MSGGEIVLIVLVVLLLFGSDKIPEFARMWGKGMREFRKATYDIRRELEQASSPLKDLKDEAFDIKKTLKDNSPLESLERDMASLEKDYSVNLDQPSPKPSDSTDATEKPPVVRTPHAAWKEPKPNDD